jgi:hypothetical protein
MPDGFNPHVELARIYNLRELMTGCRQLVPQVMQVIEAGLADPDIAIRLQTANMVMDRGFGKPRQHVEISDSSVKSDTKVYIHLPDNGRGKQVEGPTIDAEG